MLADLDDPAAQDPALVGAKAAWLARGRAVGLPVLPGVVVPAPASQEHLRAGVDALGRRGSGGARLEVTARPLDPALAAALGRAVAGLGRPLVVRSSSALEESGAWSGAFTSYLDVAPDELEVAVRGCWAATFGVAALERHGAAGIEPGSVPMAVLVQPALAPDFGGTARVEGEAVVVVGVAGSPAPLVQGWDPGAVARVTASGEVVGDEARALLGDGLLREVAAIVRRARELTGAVTCEWAAAGGTVTILQLGRAAARPAEPLAVPPALRSDAAARLARLVRRAPGPLGEALVLPWAVAGLGARVVDEEVDGAGGEGPWDPAAALDAATLLAGELAARAWDDEPGPALARAAAVLRELRGDDPGAALAAIANLRPPDRAAGRRLLGLLARVRHGLTAAGAVARPEVGWHVEPDVARSVLRGGRPAVPRARVGHDRWEPFAAAVVLATGRTAHGVPAAPGIGTGRLWAVADPSDAAWVRPRDVVVTSHPVPMVAPLLWNAAAVVTTGGGPAAHLFESARALGIPAVCGIHLDEVLEMPWREAAGRYAVAVDGGTGTVAVAPW